jgi:hypothetical protein
LSSLPQIFATELHTIPAPIPYLTMDKERVAHWGRRLNAAFPKRRLRVGLSWSGRSTHPNNLRRSIRLETLAPVLSVPGIDFVSLQKPFPDEDRPFAQTIPSFLELAPELTDFSETGAAIRNLDLVIAVDTAVVHLTGAMGSEAWVMVPEPADWRWLLNRTDSPWYPTLRLFRQKRAGEWAPVMAELAQALRERT